MKKYKLFEAKIEEPPISHCVFRLGGFSKKTEYVNPFTLRKFKFGEELH